MTNVLTWTRRPEAAVAIGSRRLAALQASHHAMWNYVTYRDAIALVGGNADDLYPEGTTRLPDDWADLGWLTCFHGPPASALEAMRAALVPDALDVYPPDLIEPLREEAARALGRERDASFEVVGTEGAQAGLSLALLAAIDPGDEVILGDPGYFHLPAAVLAAGGVPVTVASAPGAAIAWTPTRWRRRSRRARGRSASSTRATPTARWPTDDEVAALTALAERHGLLLIHDVTHGLLAIEPDAPPVAAPAGEHAVATFSVSHCFGMAGARLGFLGGPPALMRGCLQLKAALTRLNTNLVSQRGALAALRDAPTATAPRRRSAPISPTSSETLAGIDGAGARRGARRGLACALELDDEGPTAQELMVALFARQVAVYPGDGLGEQRAATTMRLNLSRPATGRWSTCAARSARRSTRRPQGAGASRSPRCSTARAPPAPPGWPTAYAAADDDGRAHGRARIAAVAGRPRPRAHAPARVPRHVDAGVARDRGGLLLQDQPAAGHPARARRRGRRARGRLRGRVRAGARRHRCRGARRHRQRPGQVRCPARARGERRCPGRRRLGARAERAARAGVERVGLRVALAGIGVEPTRFGITPALVPEAAARARTLGLDLEVLTAHLVSTGFERPLADAARLGAAITVQWPSAPAGHAAAAARLARLSVSLGVGAIDLGGGYPAAPAVAAHAPAVAQPCAPTASPAA